MERGNDSLHMLFHLTVCRKSCACVGVMDASSRPICASCWTSRPAGTLTTGLRLSVSTRQSMYCIDDGVGVATFAVAEGGPGQVPYWALAVRGTFTLRLAPSID